MAKIEKLDYRVHFSKPSRTKQSFEHECNINSIMRKALNSGLLPTRSGGSYGDFTKFPSSYHDAANFVISAHDRFMELPAELRARFHNDPGELLDFVDNPANQAEAVRLGLIPEVEGVDTPSDKKSSSGQPEGNLPPAQ